MQQDSLSSKFVPMSTNLICYHKQSHTRNFHSPLFCLIEKPNSYPSYLTQGGKCRDISAIYRRYIVYREGSTRYFVKKNRRGDISVNIAKISAIYRFWEIYRRYFEKIASGDKISVIYRRYIGDISEIYR